MYKVMVVDDEDIILNGIVKSMPWASYNCQVVATANDAMTALREMEKTPPDILFTDISMPNMDGLSLIAATKASYPNLQITILSGYPDFEYAQRAIELGVVKYILKPSKFSKLEEALAIMVENLEVIYHKDDTQDIEKSHQGDKAQNFIIKNAITYIEQNYNKKLTLSDVADHVYVSQWHLSKLIAKNTSQSFLDILNGVRISKAKELLKDPSLKIWEISDSVGFADVTHFSRIFKKLVGISANEYRNK